MSLLTYYSTLLLSSCFFILHNEWKKFTLYSHLMYGLEGNSFIFPRVLLRQGKHQDLRENKTNKFPVGPYIKCFVIYLDFPFNNHSKTNKQTTERATTVELYPGQDTFVFDKGYVTKNQPIAVLVLLSESLLYNNNYC